MGKVFTLLVCVLVISGCAALQRPDGSTDPVKVEQAGATVAATSATFGPVGQLVGAIALGLTGALATYLRGKEVGWVEAKGKPVVPAVPPES